MGEYENVKLTVQDGIATVLLDRPPVNAISTALYKDIAAVFAEIGDRTDEIRVAILTGNGRCFCAGRDLKLTETEPWEARARHTRAAFSAVYRSAVPVIAAVNGPAMGAGFIMTVLCDIVVAAENAVFCLPEIDAGLNMSIATLRRVCVSGAAPRWRQATLRFSPSGSTGPLRKPRRSFRRQLYFSSTSPRSYGERSARSAG